MKFIDKLSKLELKAKQAGIFDTYMGGDYEKAAKKMENRLREKAPSLKLMTSALSIRVDASQGPVAEGELPKAMEFGKKIAAQL